MKTYIKNAIFCNEKTMHRKDIKSTYIAFDDIRICCVKSGSALWEIGGKKISVSKGDIIFLNSSDKRRFLEFADESFTILITGIDRRVLFNTRHLTFFINYIKEKSGIIKNCPHLESILDEIRCEYSQKNEGYDEMIIAKLTEFLIICERSFNVSQNEVFKVDESMFKVLKYIENRLPEDISITEAAKIANLSESTFSRYFKRCNGIGFKRYVMQKRVEMAIALISEDKKNVIDVAYECGFSSISGFYSAFFKITGTTPRKISELTGII